MLLMFGSQVCAGFHGVGEPVTVLGPMATTVLSLWWFPVIVCSMASCQCFKKSS